MHLRAAITVAFILFGDAGPCRRSGAAGPAGQPDRHGHRRHRCGAAWRARHRQQSAVDWGRTVSRRGRARHVPICGLAAGHLPRCRHARRIRDHAARERRGWRRHGGDRRHAAARGGHGSHSGRRRGGASRGRAQRLLAGDAAAALSRSRSRAVEPVGGGPGRTRARHLPRRRVGRSGVRDETVARWHRQQRPGDWVPRRRPEGELDRFHPGGLCWGARRVRGIHQRPDQRRHPVRIQPIQRPRRVLGDRTAVDAVQPRGTAAGSLQAGRDAGVVEPVRTGRRAGAARSCLVLRRGRLLPAVLPLIRLHGTTRRGRAASTHKASLALLAEAVDGAERPPCASKGSSSASTARRATTTQGPASRRRPAPVPSTRRPSTTCARRGRWASAHCSRRATEASTGAARRGQRRKRAGTARPRTAIRPRR